MSRNISKKSKKVAKISQKFSDEQINSSFTENALKMMKKRYLQKDEKGNQETPAQMFHRIARGLAEVEKKYDKNAAFIKKTEQDFFGIMSTKEYTPAGRTITNVGADTPIVANCIVLPIKDSLDEIFQTLKEAALLQQAGSGLGFAFSHLRPAGSRTKRTNGISSGPIEFLRIYNTAFGIIKQQGRHGANMAIMRVDHPDILDFIHCKAVEGEIRNFNISIGITDEFMKAVTEKPNEPWLATYNGVKMKPHRVLRSGIGAVTGFEELDITAKQLFDEIVEGAWRNGEPGVVNIDAANRTNPLPQLGDIDATNPCGEQFLHHYDVCNLGSINLSTFVKDNHQIDWERLRFVTRTTTRLMDNVIDLYGHPVQKVTDRTLSTRRLGLGIMGFADMLYKMGVQYNSDNGRDLAEKVMGFVSNEAHKMSQDLAKEKGVFPLWKDSVWGKKGVKMRNAALTTVAPTGSISMMFDCSSGIEPNFALYFTKQDKDGLQYKYLNPVFEQALKEKNIDINSLGIIEELGKTGSVQNLSTLPKEIRDVFVVSMDISAEDHIKMQAAFQKHTDNSISKTINFPNSATREEIAAGYVLAWKMKCKGMTFYRDGSRSVQILNVGSGEGMKSTTEAFGKTKNEAVTVVEKPMNLEMDKHRIEPRKRPEIMAGKTYRVKTGYGYLYVTINDDSNNEPFEVFATLGKSGGFFQEQSEGLCRLISRLLRSRVKVEEIIKDLKGIRGPVPIMTNKGTILSLPDAVAQILEEHVSGVSTEEVKPIENDKTPELVAAGASQRSDLSSSIQKKQSMQSKSLAEMGMMPQCPDCSAALVLQEGCSLCKVCGFSRCS